MIAILVLLIAFLFPTVNRALSLSRRVACARNLGQIALAMRAYAMDNQDYFPASSQYDPHVSPYDWIWYQKTPILPQRPIADVDRSPIVRYLGGTTKPLICPVDDVSQHPFPSGKRSGTYPFSYVMNANLDFARYRMRVTRVKQPTVTILLVEEEESSFNDGNWNPGTTLTGGDRDLLGIRHDGPKDSDTDPRTQNFLTHPNGRRRGNVVCVDGHVEFLSRVEAHDVSRTQP